MVRLEAEHAIAQAFGDREKLLRDRACYLEASTACPRKQPESPQRLKELGRWFPETRAKFTRAQVGALDFRRSEASGYLDRGAERQEQPQLPAHLFGAGRQSPRELDALCEVRDGLDVARSLERLGPRFIEICDGLVPDFPLDRVMSELLGLLAQAVRVESLDRFNDPGVERAAALAEKSPVGDLVRQRVLEGVLELRKEIGLVQELGGLELDEVLSQLLVRQIRDRVEKPERNVRSDDGGRLEYGLLCRRQAIDPRREQRLHGRRHLDRAQRPLQTVGAALPHETLRLDEGPHALLE